MKKPIFILLFSLLCSSSFAQNKKDAQSLVEEGVSYHDKGDYAGAIAKYDKALEIDKDNLLALTEKAFTLMSLQKYDEAITYCQEAIAVHKGEEGLEYVYVTYGNAEDALQKSEKAIEIYNEGIKQYPDYYQLYFNKGVSLAGIKKTDEALVSFQKAVILNPKHGSSHNAIGRISHAKNQRIPALLAYGRFLVIEPQSARAKENLTALQTIMKGNVEKTGRKSMTINVTTDMLPDSSQTKENNFSSTDFILSLSAAMDLDKKNKKQTPTEQFLGKFEGVCSSLKETKDGQYGFFWEYYAPYFIEMRDRKFLETYAYIVFASTEAPDVAKWLKDHKNETAEFFDWSKSFKWKAN